MKVELFILDEIQTGFARTGKMFAAEHWNLKPDLMTTAKGLGGGVPIAGVSMTNEIASAIEYGDIFSTYGGNPVCSAIALENINIIEEMNLIQNAKEVGKLFMDELGNLMKKRKIIGDIRGKGLMIGVELVNDRNKKTPATKEARLIIEKLLSEGVIMGLGGFYSNVIRIEPPLIISEEEANICLDKLDHELKKY